MHWDQNIIFIIIAAIIYILLQVVFLGATPASLVTHGFSAIPADNAVALAPFAGLSALVGLVCFLYCRLTNPAFFKKQTLTRSTQTLVPDPDV